MVKQSTCMTKVWPGNPYFWKSRTKEDLQYSSRRFRRNDKKQKTSKAYLLTRCGRRCTGKSNVKNNTTGLNLVCFNIADSRKRCGQFHDMTQFHDNVVDNYKRTSSLRRLKMTTTQQSRLSDNDSATTAQRQRLRDNDSEMTTQRQLLSDNDSSITVQPQQFNDNDSATTT